MEISITHLSRERYLAGKQIGLSISQEWHSFAKWLSSPMLTTITDPDEAKKAAGAWCPCALIGGVVAQGRGTFDVIAADVDGCGTDGFERTCAALAGYLGLVVSTCNRSNEDDRHRAVLVLDRRMSIDEFPIVWRQFDRRMRSAGIVQDQKCKNANRLYFAPVQKAGNVFKVRHLTGAPLPVDAMLATGRKFEIAEAERLAREAEARRPKHRTSSAVDYASRALELAAQKVASAPKGSRNDLLNRETHSVSRLMELSDSEIWAAMAPAGERAGLSRLEVTRTIASALKARRHSA